MASKITGRRENYRTKLEIYTKGSYGAKATTCPECGWTIHASLSSYYPVNFCVRCGYPLKHLREFRDLDGFSYIDHEAGFRINVGGPGDTTIRLFNRIVDIEELRQFVKEHGRKM